MQAETDNAFARLAGTAFTSDGAYACLTFDICDQTRESVKLTYDAYAELVRGRTEFSPEDMEAISREGQYCAALLSALGSLSYGANTQMELYRKLIKKHFPKEAALRAVKRLKSIGFIKEDAIVREEVRSCLGKLWGPSRIRARLTARGFGKKAFAIGMSIIEETDFDGICLECAKKRIKNMPQTYEERQKSVAALVRLGHSYDSSKRAIDMLTNGEEFF